MDGPEVVIIISLRICSRGGCFTQHIVGKAKSLDLESASIFQRLCDAAAADEMRSHHSHRERNAALNERSAAFSREASECRTKRPRTGGRNDTAGNQKS